MKILMPWVDKTASAEDTKIFIRGALREFAENEGLAAGIFCDDRLAGVIGLHNIDLANKKASMGYWIDEEHQGRGLVTRACKAILDYVFGDLELNRVFIFCALENTRSKAVPKRLGFKLEGIHRNNEWLYDHFVDHECYAILNHEWKALSQRPGQGCVLSQSTAKHAEST